MLPRLCSCLGIKPNKTRPNPPPGTPALGMEERESVLRLPSPAMPSSTASSATEAETKAETTGMKRQLEMQAEYLTMVGLVGVELARLGALLEEQAKKPRAGDNPGSVLANCGKSFGTLLSGSVQVSKKKKAMKLSGGICALLAIGALITAAVAAGGNMAQPHNATLLQPTIDKLEQPTDNPTAAESLLREALEDNSSGTPTADPPQPHSNLADPPGDGGGGKAQALPWLIQLAIAEGKVSHVEAWLVHGGDVDVRDEDGATLLMSAAFYRREPTVQMLLRRGAAVNLQTPAGLTALMAATLNGDTAIMRRLLEAGGATGLRSGYGETALQMAKRKGFADCARLLQSHEPPSGDRP